MPIGKTITLAHGAGGRASDELIREIILPALGGDPRSCLPDSVVLSNLGERLAFTTDSYTVSPLFFPGGNIGKLAVYGTVNDLAMSGAEPLLISLGLILEEGLEIDLLRRIIEEIGEATKETKIRVVTGDTKVVGRGAVDKIFVNTSGIGALPAFIGRIAPNQARPGDVALVSGALGDHGIAVMAAREKLSFTSNIKSDCAPLHTLVATLLRAAPHTRCLRDPTRGGAAATLNEIARASRVGIELDENAIPVHREVMGLAELLGLDPLFLANEGKLIAVVPEEEAEAALAALREHHLGFESNIIGKVTSDHPASVVIKTTMRTHRVVEYPAGELLPRIC